VHAVCEAGKVDEFLLWALHWTDPATVTERVAPVATRSSAREARRSAVLEYRTQAEPLAPHLAPVLPALVLAWTYECVVTR
jgi:hypothetical protein